MAVDKYSPSFETEVLVKLTEIDGKIEQLVQAHEATASRVDRHETEISTIRALVYKGVGASACLAIVLPILIPFLRG